MEVCQATLATLTDESIVTDCGFVVPACDGNADVVSDDRFAHQMGSLCLELVGCRIMRILNVLRGWPQHLLVMLVNDELGRKAMQLFRRDHVTYEDASRDFANVPSVDAILRSSPFKTVSCQQWVHAFSQQHWKITAPIRALAEQLISIIHSSLLCEEMANFQKNSGILTGTVKQRKADTYVAVVLAKKVVEKRYRYESVVAAPSKNKHDQVEQPDFGVNAPLPSVSLKGIALTSQKAPYFRPVLNMLANPLLTLSSCTTV